MSPFPPSSSQPRGRCRRLRRRSARVSLVLAATLVGLAAPIAAHDLIGTVELTEGAAKRRVVGAELASVVVYFEPDEKPKTLPASDPYVMTTKNKAFAPRVLAVPRGAVVSFPNEDPILHNVFSLSPANKFDLGLYRKGPGKTAKFDTPGLVRVFCNVHHAMVAYVLVLDTPYFTRPDEQGRFVLRGPNPGGGTLYAWHERAEAWSQRVTVPASGTLVPQLAISKPRVPPHLNKLGKAYPRGPEY